MMYLHTFTLCHLEGYRIRVIPEGHISIVPLVYKGLVTRNTVTVMGLVKFADGLFCHKVCRFTLSKHFDFL